ncbi:Uncharacterised protein [Mycobacteroides abscessus subsp. abscessus]|nr:Uncharacterised protein [Mycobacteroides abscessus subsp. abscessus]SKW21162.1 Uncharacterised protein [Mycobacteroides abscessus subsp. abscessus]
MMQATTCPQPAIQPTYGPNARLDHVKDAPASGFFALSSR